MVNGIPVEIVWIGREGSMSPSRRLVARTTVSRSWMRPNLGSACVISPKTGSPALSSKRTGTLPTFSSRATSAAPVEPRKAKAVPSVGCPANGNSSCTVKIRTLYAALAFDGRLTRQDEGRLGKIHLARQRLHLLVAEAARVGKHGQRIAFEGAGRKNVELHEGKVAKFSCHGDLL